MKFLQHVATVIIIVGGLFLIIPLFLPATFKVQRILQINTAPNVVYQKVLDFNARQQWDPWLEKDPAADVKVRTTPDNIGSVLRWDGEKIGTGEITLREKVDNRALYMRVEFTSPYTTTVKSYWKFEPADKGTRVTWTISGPLSYPLGRYHGLLIDRTLGSACENGLKRLRAACYGGTE